MTTIRSFISENGREPGTEQERIQNGIQHYADRNGVSTRMAREVLTDVWGEKLTGDMLEWHAATDRLGRTRR